MDLELLVPEWIVVIFTHILPEWDNKEIKGSRNKINISKKESYATIVKVGKSSLEESAIYKIVF